MRKWRRLFAVSPFGWLAACTALLLLPASMALAADDFQQSLSQGEALFRSGQYEQALPSLSRALTLRANDTSARLARMQAYLNLHREREAIPDAVFLSSHHGNALAWIRLAKIYIAVQQYEKAEQAADQAVKLSASLDPFLVRADTECFLSRYGQAACDYNCALQIFINADGARERRANALNHLGQYQLAHEELLAILFQTNVDKVASPEFMKEYISRYPNALKDWDAAIKTAHGKSAGTYYGRGMCRFFAGRFDDAVADLNAAIKLDCQFMPAYLVRQLCYLRLHQPALAKADADRQIELRSDSLDSYNALNRLYFLSDQFDKCGAELSARIKKTPNNALLYVSRARWYSGTDQTKLALPDFSAAIKIKPTLACAYAGRGRSYLDLKNMEAADKDLSKAWSLDAKDCQALSDRSIVYVEEGKYDKAVADLSTLIKLKYKLVKMYQARSQCYLALHQTAKAQSDRRAARDLDWQ
ncbi:MAG TPA: tetratricopeptide repeat protein [Planktothrix sp.]